MFLYFLSFQSSFFIFVVSALLLASHSHCASSTAPSPFTHLSTDEAEKAIREGDYKKAIDIYHLLIKEDREKNEFLKLGLATAYLKDQDQEKAFNVFLELLKEMKKESAPVMSLEETQLYQKALETYLDHKETPQAIAKKICQEYTPILKDHPQAYPISYILAAAHANLGQYDQFFNFFYQAYRFYPDHFIASKTKAVLHMKLFERSRTSSERELHREAILRLLSDASEKELSDTSLYKFLILFSPEEKKSSMLCTCLNKIIDKNIIISRTDVAFYVEKIVEAKDLLLAQRFISKVREWYQYSRLVNAAQQYLDKHLND